MHKYKCSIAKITFLWCCLCCYPDKLLKKVKFPHICNHNSASNPFLRGISTSHVRFNFHHIQTVIENCQISLCTAPTSCLDNHWSCQVFEINTLQLHPNMILIQIPQIRIQYIAHDLGWAIGCCFFKFKTLHWRAAFKELILQILIYCRTC